MVQSLGLRSPTSGVQAPSLTVVPRYYKPHSIEDKTPRLLVKAILKSPEDSEKLRHKSSDTSKNIFSSF